MTSPASDDRTQSPRFRLVLAGALVVLLLAAVVFSVVTLAAGGGRADAVQSSREQVMAQSEQFMLRMGSFGPELLDEQGQMPQYREQVTEVITPKFAADFEKQVGVAEQLAAEAGLARQVDVFSTGVSSLDEDSARALVAGSFTNSYDAPAPDRGTKGDRQGGSDPGTVEPEPVPFRFELSLVKIDGEWLVDDFTGVGGDEGGGVAP